MQAFTHSCAKFHAKKKIAAVNSSLKIDTLLIKYFPQNYMLTKCLGREDKTYIFLVAHQKLFADPWLEAPNNTPSVSNVCKRWGPIKAEQDQGWIQG